MPISSLSDPADLARASAALEAVWDEITSSREQEPRSPDGVDAAAGVPAWRISMRTMFLALALAASVAGAAAVQAQTATTASRETYVKTKPTDVLSSNLIGLNVYNNAKENVGEIKDLVMSNENVSGLILSVGGFLGLGERYVTVAPAAVKVVYSENDKKWSATMDTTKDALKAAPEFKYEGRWSK